MNRGALGAEDDDQRRPAKTTADQPPMEAESAASASAGLTDLPGDDPDAPGDGPDALGDIADADEASYELCVHRRLRDDKYLPDFAFKWKGAGARRQSRLAVQFSVFPRPEQDAKLLLSATATVAAATLLALPPIATAPSTLLPPLPLHSPPFTAAAADIVASAAATCIYLCKIATHPREHEHHAAPSPKWLPPHVTACVSA